MFVLNDGTRKVEFHHFGWAHTRGDGFVYLPKEQVLCTGDAVVNGPYNYTADANIGNWPDGGARRREAEGEVRAAGPRRPGGREVLAGQAQFMAELHKAVKAGVEPGQEAGRDAGVGETAAIGRQLGGRELAQAPGQGHLRRDHARPVSHQW